ncbi:MAG TPA: hypothetical protein VK864_03725 [Longimicrobiales bacterium]|nr:hypothetical protein [Longimicrobiales bacterium]
MVRTSAVIIAAFAAGFGLSACSDNSVTGTDSSASTTQGPGAAPPIVSGQNVRVQCELSSGRSKVSVDGNNLRPAGALFSARIRSGANSATTPVARAIGDEIEFDFDSNPNDVAEGATAIARNFIQIGPGADVSAEILNPSGAVVVAGSADCTLR